MQIDHNPHDKRPGNGLWWVAWILTALAWASYLYSRPIDWWSLALGAFTMGVLATWAIEITGNKAPNWWRSPRRRD